jgi:hypothetical protein
MNPDLERFKIIQGKDLTDEMIGLLNNLWIKIYKEDYKKLQEKDEFENDTFFILYDDLGSIVSIGRLRSIHIEFLGKNYPILGIADIGSVKQGQGYGKKIMLKIRDFLEENNAIGIGFCEADTSEFYKKSGFIIYPGLTARFWYVDKWSGKLKNYKSDVLFWGDDELIKQIQSHPEEKVIIPYPW